MNAAWVLNGLSVVAVGLAVAVVMVQRLRLAGLEAIIDAQTDAINQARFLQGKAEREADEADRETLAMVDEAKALQAERDKLAAVNAGLQAKCEELRETAMRNATEAAMRSDGNIRGLRQDLASVKQSYANLGAILDERNARITELERQAEEANQGYDAGFSDGFAVAVGQAADAVKRVRLESPHTPHVTFGELADALHKAGGGFGADAVEEYRGGCCPVDASIQDGADS